MQPVLIQSDPSKIKEHKAFLPTGVTYLQQFYDAFKVIGIEMSITDMRNILHYQETPYLKSFITHFIGEKMLEKAGTPDFGGIPIKKQKLIELLDMPDPEDITNVLCG